MKLIPVIFGRLLFAIGLVGCLSSIYTLIDPGEAQLPNDTNPFGIPSTAADSLEYLVVSIVMLGVGIWLSWRRTG